jgi:hypothetical protein
MIVDDCGGQLACVAMRKYLCKERKSRSVPEIVRGRQLKAKQPGGSMASRMQAAAFQSFPFCREFLILLSG